MWIVLNANFCQSLILLEEGVTITANWSGELQQGESAVSHVVLVIRISHTGVTR